MDDLDLVRAARTKTTGPTDAATAAARAKLAARLERPSRFSLRPRFSPLAISIATVAAVAVVATIAFTAFGQGVKGLHDPAVGPAPTSTPSSVPTPNPTSTPIETSTPSPTSTPIEAIESAAWTSPPKQLLDGDCNSLLSTAQVNEVLGEGELATSADDLALSQTDITKIWPLFADLAHNGGLACGWRNESESRFQSGPVLWVAALPAALVPDARSSTECLGSNDGGCRFRVGADGILFDVFISDPKPGAVETAAELVLGRVPSIGSVPAIWSPRSGDWPTDVDCKSIGDAAIDKVATGKWGASTRDAADMSAVGFDLAQGHGARGCVYGDSFGISYLAGGAWVESAIKNQYPDATHPAIDGADRTYRFTQELDGLATITMAIVGDNLLMLNPGWEGDELVDEFAPAFIRALNTAGATNVTLSTAGWGSIRLGQPVPRSAVGVRWIPEMLPGCVPTSNWQIDAGGYIYTEDPSRENSMLERGPVTEIRIFAPEILTKSGAHVGMSVAEMRELLPAASRDAASGAWVVADDLGQVVFYPHSGEDQSPIETIRVLPVGVDPSDFVSAQSCD